MYVQSVNMKEQFANSLWLYRMKHPIHSNVCICHNIYRNGLALAMTIHRAGLY